MDDHVLNMNYKSPPTRSLKCYILDITWSPWRWLYSQDKIVYPRYLRRLAQGMRCDEILDWGSENIRRVPNYFACALVLSWVIDKGLSIDHNLSHSWVLCEWRIIRTW